VDVRLEDAFHDEPTPREALAQVCELKGLPARDA
jgi:hypothetical protein